MPRAEVDMAEFDAGDSEVRLKNNICVSLVWPLLCGVGYEGSCMC